MSLSRILNDGPPPQGPLSKPLPPVPPPTMHIQEHSFPDSRTFPSSPHRQQQLYVEHPHQASREFDRSISPPYGRDDSHRPSPSPPPRWGQQVPSASSASSSKRLSPVMSRGQPPEDVLTLHGEPQYTPPADYDHAPTYQRFRPGWEEDPLPTPEPLEPHFVEQPRASSRARKPRGSAVVHHEDSPSVPATTVEPLSRKKRKTGGEDPEYHPARRVRKTL